MTPSIFNDVLGPVMRGPSSSHCAASLRIGRVCRDLMDEWIESAHIRYDPNGSLATTHEGQGSDMGLFSGFLGYDADDPRLVEYRQAVQESGIDITIEITEIDADHPNTYDIELKNASEHHHIVALSTGGGMIEIIRIDDQPVSFFGDDIITLVFTESEIKPVHPGAETRDGFQFIRSREPLAETTLEQLRSIDGVSTVRTIHTVLPIRTGSEAPFLTRSQMDAWNAERQLSLWQLAEQYESIRGGITVEEVRAMMDNVLTVMETAIQTGLAGTVYADRILGAQSPGFKAQFENQNLLPGDTLNRAIMYVSAIMEAKSAMEVIVAAPTAGSCGACPGAVIATAETLGVHRDELINAMLIAGLIGVFIADGATFAAEVGGCMAETGSGAGMAAAALTYLGGGDADACMTAASMALQNSFGLVCDPVANRVEAPCLGKNVMAASNAISCANMALSGYDPVIPFDEVIVAMNDTTHRIPHELRCTALAGLSTTPTSKALEAGLAQDAEIPIHQRFKIC